MRLHSSLRQRVPIHFPEMAEPMLMAAVVGFMAGLGALLFKWLLDVISRWVSGPIFALFAPLGRFQGILSPAMGGLLAGLLMYYFGHGLKGHSVPEIIESVALHGGRISPQVHLTQACASILTIGSGGSAGRVAPVVQIGAAVGSGLGQLLRLPNQRVRDLVACGAAAGIAVTFNAPIAGVFFALEVVLGELS
ncbi:MAG: chloride channel protein, partial [Anaerolineae bacterium]|nr:chloride channel protein [Anaerolineae bacterium]